MRTVLIEEFAPLRDRVAGAVVVPGDESWDEVLERNANGQPTRVGDADAIETRYAYDANGNLLSVTTPAGTDYCANPLVKAVLQDARDSGVGAHLPYTDNGKTFLAIYSLEGDRLVFCAANEGQERPTECGFWRRKTGAGRS